MDKSLIFTSTQELKCFSNPIPSFVTVFLLFLFIVFRTFLLAIDIILICNRYWFFTDYFFFNSIVADFFSQHIKPPSPKKVNEEPSFYTSIITVTFQRLKMN